MTEQEMNTEVTTEQAVNEQTEATTETDENTENARLKAEYAKLKAALDKATKEAGDAKKALRAHQSAEEAAAEAEKERHEAIEKELNELRKERAVANSSKRIMTFVQDEKTATQIAEALYGAADIDLAVDVIGKAWAAREKALRQEFGKIPSPGVGAADGPTITKAQLDGMTLKDRLEFANKHHDEYNKLMGR